MMTLGLSSNDCRHFAAFSMTDDITLSILYVFVTGDSFPFFID
jgi:hypothetical protein